VERSPEELAAPEHLEQLRALLRQGDFFADLSVIPGSQSGLLALSRDYEIFVCTAAMEFPGSFGPKFEWLRRHFSFIPTNRVVFCGDKSAMRADFLVDDLALNLARFSGQGILFATPHNWRERRFPRVKDWPDLVEHFLDGKLNGQEQTRP